MSEAFESLARDEAIEAFETLTLKQRQVLDLVLEHKSSKEIARILEISPYTVDQRIAAARLKLNAGSRGELARVYARMRNLCEETAYGFPQFVNVPEVFDPESQEGGTMSFPTLADSGSLFVRPPWGSEPARVPLLEAMDARFGILGRIGLVVAMAIGLAIMTLTMVAVAQALSALL